MPLGTRARDKIAGQVKSAAEKIGVAVLAALAIAVGAIVIAAAALFISLRKVTA